MKLLAVFMLAAALYSQTIPIDIIVNPTPPQLAKVKYGSLPKWAAFGEVVGCNRGATDITYGEGDVIALLRASGTAVYSRQDALPLVSNAQNANPKAYVMTALRAAASSVVDAKAAGLFGGGATGVVVVTAGWFVQSLLPNITQALNLRQVIAYNVDGLQSVKLLHAGRCTVPASILLVRPVDLPAKWSADVPAGK